MWKDKAAAIRDFIIGHSKIVFPVIVIAVVAVTVTAALSAGDAGGEVQNLTGEELSVNTSVSTLEDEVREVPLVENSDDGITALVHAYYNALAEGDMDTISALCEGITTQDLLRFQENAKFIAGYPVIEIYTKPGLDEGTTLAYVYYRVVFNGHEEEFPGYQTIFIGTNEQGSYYIMREDLFSPEVSAYVQALNEQDDVVLFNNRVTTEYNDLMLAHPELLTYLSELDSFVSTSVGEIMAQQNVAAEEGSQEGTPEGGETPAEGEAGENGGEEAQPAEPAVLYASATTTVNVRSSDSENADKLGKVTGGTKLQILEQRVNGWTKVLFEGREGFIKSEYLELVESAAGAEVIGTVTASTNINVRASASENADRLGVLAGGETVDLLANENGWCKINYNGQIGFVKADYVD